MELEYQRQTGWPEEPRNAGPFPSYRETPFAAPHTVRRDARREESDDYGEVVAILNPTLRVICGRCGLQWVVQCQKGKRNGVPIWQSFAYCGTKEGLLLRLPKGGHGCAPEAWAVIEALPDYFPKRAKGEEVA
jgi:hypothetical protein